MKRFLRFLKWSGIIILALILGLAIVISLRQDLSFDAPYPDIHATRDTAVIARGRHLVYSMAHCADCHSRTNADSLVSLGEEVPLSGGVAFKLPLGTLYSANITSDSVTGIGKYSDPEIARVLRFGVHPDGAAVYDFMPFHNLCDSDLTAIISYLRTQKPVSSPKPENSLNLAGYAVKAFMVKPVGPSETIQASVKPDTTEEYGKYIVLNVGNCSGCHTQRSISGAYIGELLAGGNPMENGLVPPNLTPDSSGRIFYWTEEMFIKRFRMGKLNPKSEMPWNSFKRMTDDELKAAYKYLKSIKPVKTELKKTNS